MFEILEIIMLCLFAGYKIIMAIGEFDSIFIEIIFVLDTRILAIKNAEIIQYICCAAPTRPRLQILIILTI